MRDGIGYTLRSVAIQMRFCVTMMMTVPVAGVMAQLMAVIMAMKFGGDIIYELVGINYGKPCSKSSTRMCPPFLSNEAKTLEMRSTS